MWKKVVLGLAASALVLVAVIALQPSSFAIERSILIEAPPGLILSQIQDLRAMNAWSPWVKMDPDLKIAYDGPEAGVGARSSWEGPRMGKGSLTVTAVKPEREVEMRLSMLAPMSATNRILFRLQPTGEATRVTWHMDGRNNFVGKALGLFVSLDEMVGVPFEQGLAALETVAEAQSQREPG
jgi:hypothetical protein